MDPATIKTSNSPSAVCHSGRIYENIVTNGGNVQFGDTYLLNDETFQSCSLEQQRSALLGALDYTGSGAKRAQLNLHETGTESYNWIESTALFSWLRSPEAPLFHIVGKPASGKSTLMRYLTDSRKVRDELATTAKPWTIVHYFFDFRGDDTPANDPLGMVKLFMRQLMKISKETESFLLRQESIDRLKGSDLNVCIDVLTDAVQLSGLSICAFVDGLDEYGGRLWHLCNYLEIIRYRTGMKMCLASRPEPEILKACSSCPSLIMQDHNKESIKFHIRRRVDEISIFEPEVESLFTPDLCDALVRKADGVILWARLALDELLLTCESSTTAETLSHRLDNLEPDLGHIYERILERIPQRLKHDAALILLLLERMRSKYNEERICLQAIMFIQKQCGLNSFLGGSLEAVFMRKRLAIYLANIVQSISSRGVVVHHDNRISLIHLSLAAYIRRTSWVKRHLNVSVGTKYGTLTCSSLLKEVATTASLENAFNTTIVVDQLWKEAELVAMKNSLAQKGSQTERSQPVYLGQIPFSVMNDINIRNRSISSSWHCFMDLLELAVQELPKVLPCDGLESRQGQRPSRALNDGCIAWHILVCPRCSVCFTRLSTIDHLRCLQRSGNLDLAMAVVHRDARAIDMTLATEHASLDLVMSALSIALNTGKSRMFRIPGFRQGYWRFVGYILVILKHYTRIQAILKSVDEPSIVTNGVYNEAVAAVTCYDEERAQRYDALYSDISISGEALSTPEVLKLAHPGITMDHSIE